MIKGLITKDIDAVVMEQDEAGRLTGSKTVQITIRELLGSELRAARAGDCYRDEVLVQNGVPQDVVDHMTANEQRRIWDEINELSGFKKVSEPAGNSPSGDGTTKTATE